MTVENVHRLILRTSILVALLSAVPPSTVAHAADRQSIANVSLLEPFVDGIVTSHLVDKDVAGAVVAIVKDGAIVFAKGYGYADVERRRPVTVDETLFRPASISKLFTWTAVMQLVEQGRLDLDRDVRDYLDFAPPGWSDPITLRHLMTHTAGFQEATRVMVPNGGSIIPSPEYFRKYAPPRIFAAGTTPAYSNYGAGLAGYIVERVSGLSFAEYVDRQIFRPLGMRHSTFVQPLPDALKPMMSEGYVRGSEASKPFEITQMTASGGLSSTAQDMIRFMLAHLGRLDEARILRAETATLMQSRQFGLLESANGATLGFSEDRRNGLRAIGHGGDLECFHSQLFLVPEERLGFFMSQNSRGTGPLLRGILWRALIDRYYPVDPASTDLTAGRDDGIEGWYKTSRRFDRSAFALNSLLNETYISAHSDGTISLGNPGNRFRRIAPMVYRHVTRPERLIFRKSSATGFEVIGEFPAVIFQRARWFESRTFNLTVIAFSAGVFAATVVLWPVGMLVRWHYGRTLDLTRGQKWRRLLIRIVSVLSLSFLVLGRVMMTSLGDPEAQMWIPPLQTLGVVAIAGSAIVFYDAARCWTEGGRWWFSRLHALALALACAGFVWFVLMWDLLVRPPT
jgi:CubicO group peptidase (beta-lactamase class C family)